MFFERPGVAVGCEHSVVNNQRVDVDVVVVGVVPTSPLPDKKP